MNSWTDRHANPTSDVPAAVVTVNTSDNTLFLDTVNMLKVPNFFFWPFCAFCFIQNS